MRPQLTDENKKARVAFAMKFLVYPENGILHDFLDHVHIDEKLFYITKEKCHYYLVPGETPIERSCKSKHFIDKCMFIAAVARPRYNPVTGEYFNGKICIEPFVEYVEAKRTSKNRVKGTIEVKSLNKINRTIIRSYLINKVSLKTNENVYCCLSHCCLFAMKGFFENTQEMATMVFCNPA